LNNVSNASSTNALLRSWAAVAMAVPPRYAHLAFYTDPYEHSAAGWDESSSGGGVAMGDRADDVTRQPGADPATGLVGQSDSCNRCGHCHSFGFKELPAREVSGDEKRHYWTDGRRAVLAALSRISTAYRRTRTDDAAGGGELPVRAAAGAGTAPLYQTTLSDRVV
jgi:hypothetical protein